MIFFFVLKYFLRYRCVGFVYVCTLILGAVVVPIGQKFLIGDQLVSVFFFFKKPINFTFFKQHCVQWAHPMSIFQRYSLELTVYLQIPTYSLYVIISSLYSSIHFLSLCVHFIFIIFQENHLHAVKTQCLSNKRRR